MSHLHDRQRLFSLQLRQKVTLVEDQEPRLIRHVQFFEDSFHLGDLLLEAGVGAIHHVKKKIGVLKFLQGGLECPHERFGKGTDEPDRVGDDHLPLPGKTEPSGGGVESGKEEVLGENRAFGKGVQQGRLAGIGIADDGDYRNAGQLAALPVMPAVRPHMFLQELRLNLDYLRHEVEKLPLPSLPEPPRHIKETIENLLSGIRYYHNLVLNATIEQPARFLSELGALREGLLKLRLALAA